MQVKPPTALAGKCHQVYAQNHRASLDEQTVVRLYCYMLKCRTVEERIRVLFQQGKFSGDYLSAVGQEATEVGVRRERTRAQGTLLEVLPTPA
jgi:TPP-dependent pyruvate/acetoin dehydrogenase alpha subunit